MVPLTTGFRVPAVVLALANRLLPVLDVDVPPAVSLRHDGDLLIRQVADLSTAVVAEVRCTTVHPGSVAVIAADDQIDALRTALWDAGVAAAELDSGGEAPVTLVPATAAKGLEYDCVIVVEPAAIVAAEPRGLHRLYVVLTRAVTRLVVRHRQPLPGPLTDPESHSPT